VAAIAVAGCSSPRRGATSSTSTSPATSRPTTPGTTGAGPTSSVASSTPPAVSAAEWSSLGSSLSGRLVLPADPGYLANLQLCDSRFDSVRPAGIAYCASETDIQRCVGFARTHGLEFAARSGGHSYAGYSTSTGLVVDVTGMAAVAIAPGATTIGAGARLIDVYTRLNASGVSIPAGSCPTVGIAGLTLGGGVGVVDRAYGLTCDALRSLRVVTADAQVVTADSTTNDDLYWACRGGGGGNFGIATALTFATFATSPVTLYFLTWPWDAAADVVPAWLAWAPGAPDPLWSNCLLEANPSAASPTLSVGVVWQGPPGTAGPLVDQLQAAVGTPPSSRFVETVPFSHAMYVEGGCANFSQAACHLPTQAPGGALTRQPSLAKSSYVGAALSNAGVQAIVAGVEARQADGAQGAAGLDAYGGAINRVPPGATAFVHRTALASVQYNVPFDVGTPAAQLAASQSWLDTWVDSLAPYMNGQAYQNYVDPHLAGWASAYYGANLARLEQVKQAWDPDDAFRFAQSIPLP